ncbi:MAG: hypothetical protein MZV64_48370 [Ignavibacteriales bacterium]|nr:hypothetical protein [Ignavibacteriales bacterium]
MPLGNPPLGGRKRGRYAEFPGNTACLYPFRTADPGQALADPMLDNRIKEIDPGVNSHSVSDHTQTNWNGIVGKMVLHAKPPVHIHNIEVFPNISNGTISAKIKITNQNQNVQKVKIVLRIENTANVKDTLITASPVKQILTQNWNRATVFVSGVNTIPAYTI